MNFAPDLWKLNKQSKMEQFYIYKQHISWLIIENQKLPKLKKSEVWSR
jgi:hypothetical protein